ncbi:MAG: Uncharacterised protein [Flavobacteriales bacterium UBA4585]|jgi:hypothetical protein|nr:MAG: Uncharacterised protein [Flavobacteriales bacterium UBA4585]|tara:strand:- start:437 stop:928 length:492 start_codon:yes stop_codon:yes gene_type:complete
MKKILLTFITAGALLAVSCTTEPVATETFIREDVVGEWTVNQVAYSGEMPNPINPSALMQFSGIGTQLYGKINIYEMPDTGNLHVDFVANLNTIQVPVSLISGGTWYLENNDSTLVLDNDSVSYAFKMISGLSTRQIWQTSFMQIPTDSSYWADIDLELTLIK